MKDDRKNLLVEVRGSKADFFATDVGLIVKTFDLVGKLVEFDGKNVATRLKEEMVNILAELRGRNDEIRMKNEEKADSRAEKYVRTARLPLQEVTLAPRMRTPTPSSKNCLSWLPSKGQDQKSGG